MKKSFSQTTTALAMESQVHEEYTRALSHTPENVLVFILLLAFIFPLALDLIHLSLGCFYSAFVCVSPPDEVCSHSRQLCGGNQAATERMIQFGRELQALNEQLCQEYGKNTTHKKMLQVHTHSTAHGLELNKQLQCQKTDVMQGVG